MAVPLRLSRMLAALLALAVGIFGAAFHLFYGSYALNDPQMGLALSASSEESMLSAGRVKLQLLAGANPDSEQSPWGVGMTPLMTAIDVRNHKAIATLSPVSSKANWTKAVLMACGREDAKLLEALSNEVHGDAARLCLQPTPG